MNRRWVTALLGLAAVLATALGTTACQTQLPITAPSSAPGSAPASPSVSTSTAPADPSPAPCPEPGSASDGVRVEGALFAAPTVTFTTPLSVTAVEASTPIASTGEKVAAGDVVHVAYQVYSGKTGKLIESTNHGNTELVPLHVGNGLLPGLRGALACAGTQSRMVVVIPPAQAYGDRGSSSLGVGGGETVVFVIDVDSVTRKADLPTE